MFSDQAVNPASNEHRRRDDPREDPRRGRATPRRAEALCPKDYPFGTKRPCLDTSYFETFNLPHVRLVDLRRTPIVAITEAGIDTAEESFEFDAIVFATGFDAMTGPLVAVDVTGADGRDPEDKWADGPSTYLGLTTAGFPNFFTITGPRSPSVLSQHGRVDRAARRLDRRLPAAPAGAELERSSRLRWPRRAGSSTTQDCADITLYPRANSWYMGANVPGKPRVFLPYVGGVDAYRRACDEVVEKGFSGSGSTGRRVTVQRRSDPSPAAGRGDGAGTHGFDGAAPHRDHECCRRPGLLRGDRRQRPPGPGGRRDRRRRAARPGRRPAVPALPAATPGPHPLIAYFHGGGWVLGSQDSDDPLCRDLCVRTGSVVVSVNYRHAPEDRFPAAADDAFAAACVDSGQRRRARRHPRAARRRRLERRRQPRRPSPASWPATPAGRTSPGSCCYPGHRLRHAAGPPTPSNGEGYVLTAAPHAVVLGPLRDPADRADPRASPLRGDLAGLPPAVVVTAEFDPLRDEGDAYAEALAAAGVPVRHIRARGHIHTSLTMVDAVISGAPVRAEIAEALDSFRSATVRS